MSAPGPLSPLEATLREIERHADAAGWDRPPQLFALVDTAALLDSEPGLAERLGLSAETAGYTPVEQDALPDRPLDEALAGIMWPEGVLGCALVHEVLVLPPEAERTRPMAAEADRWAREHADRREVRLAVAVLADGTSASAVRLRAPRERPDELLYGEDLAPNLREALLGTLR